MKASGDLLKRQHELILDSLAEGVFTIDLDWRITSFNRAAERITGVSRSEALGKPCFEVFRADMCETGCVLRRTIKTKTPIANMSVYIYRADNKRIPISISTTLLKNANGEIIGGVETFQDVSALKYLQKELRKENSFEDIISKNENMMKIFSVLPQVAESNSTVLILGDSGTGKELVARAIHNQSPHRKGPFIAVNCGALPDTLIESEIFGYRSGAFTDARQNKPGRFAMAQNGTILLDEIGDISSAVQIRLLRVLQEKVYEPLGSNKPVTTNARIIATTHRDLERLVREGKFREDLYFRINVFKIILPRLKERKEDIPLLVDHFIDLFNHQKGRSVKGIVREALAVLILYDWPGNVRELKNVIEHTFILCRDDVIQLKDLPENLIPPADPGHLPEGLSLRDVEKRAILQALHRNNGRKVATAKELGIDKNTLRRKILRLGIRGVAEHP
ncbi:MAG: sigma 54-interacting transcriptional regulator [Syntrophaceae bacterium]